MAQLLNYKCGDINMSVPVDSRLSEYAYEVVSRTEANAFVTDADGNPGYQTILELSYELLDVDRNFLSYKSVLHASDISPVRYTAEQVDTWLTANRYNFILADKLELAGYKPT